VDLTILFDHRFYHNQHSHFSLKGYCYSFFAGRYLQVFDRIRIVARVSDTIVDATGREPVQGDSVEIISLGDWQGPAEFLLRGADATQKLRRALLPDTALIMIVPGTIASIAAKSLVQSRRPYGLEVMADPHDLFLPGAHKHPLRSLFQHWYVRRLRYLCRNACAVSYVTQRVLQQRYPPGPRKFSLGCSDVDLPASAFVPQSRPESGHKQSYTLISVGTMVQYYKAQDVLIDAVASCVREGLPVRLVLVGDGKYRTEMERRAQTQGISDRVCFCGQLPAGDAVRAQLDQADIFVLPSRVEGLPRAMVEAMARALPCIGTTVGGIPELLPTESMVPPNDPSALATKIREVVKNPECLARMSARNLQVAQAYRAESLAGRRLAFYRHLREQTEHWLKARYEGSASFVKGV
jgi:glycosyltransferase involved in cell wall biosynthesis